MTYTVTDVKVSDFKDPHGNSWVNVAFEEYGEPVVMVVKDPSTVAEGKTFDGEIKQVQKKSGQGFYNRFYRAKPQEYGGGNSQSYSAPKKTYDRDDKAIQAQWAIGQANLQAVHGAIEPDQLEERAKDFFLMIDRVKATTAESEASSEVPPVEAYDKEVDLSEIPF